MTQPPKGSISYNYPIFEDYIAPKGALTLDKRCHACFWYGMLAQRARAAVGSGIDSQIIEYKVGELPPEWMESRDEEIARSVAIIYGLESPDEFLVYKKEAWAQAYLLGITIDEQVFLVRPGVARLH